MSREGVPGDPPCTGLRGRSWSWYLEPSEEGRGLPPRHGERNRPRLRLALVRDASATAAAAATAVPAVAVAAGRWPQCASLTPAWVPPAFRAAPAAPSPAGNGCFRPGQGGAQACSRERNEMAHTWNGTSQFPLRSSRCAAHSDKRHETTGLESLERGAHPALSPWWGSTSSQHGSSACMGLTWTRGCCLPQERALRGGGAPGGA